MQSSKISNYDKNNNNKQQSHFIESHMAKRLEKKI